MTAQTPGCGSNSEGRKRRLEKAAQELGPHLDGSARDRIWMIPDEGPMSVSSGVEAVNVLLGVNLWDAPSFRADVRIDFDEHGQVLASVLLNPAAQPDAPRPTDREGVGTGAGEGATGQDTGTAWVTRSTDCPEAPAQAHPLAPQEALRRIVVVLEELHEDDGDGFCNECGCRAVECAYLVILDLARTTLGVQPAAPQAAPRVRPAVRYDEKSHMHGDWLIPDDKCPWCTPSQRPQGVRCETCDDYGVLDGLEPCPAMCVFAKAFLYDQAIAANLRVPDGAAISCIVGGCLYGTPGRGSCTCRPEGVTVTEWGVRTHTEGAPPYDQEEPNETRAGYRAAELFGHLGQTGRPGLFNGRRFLRSEVITRQRTAFPDVVTQWAEVSGDTKAAADAETTRWECGPHTNSWGGHDARCRRIATGDTEAGERRG